MLQCIFHCYGSCSSESSLWLSHWVLFNFIKSVFTSVLRCVCMFVCVCVCVHTGSWLWLGKFLEGTELCSSIHRIRAHHFLWHTHWNQIIWRRRRGCYPLKSNNLKKEEGMLYFFRLLYFSFGWTLCSVICEWTEPIEHKSLFCLWHIFMVVTPCHGLLHVSIRVPGVCRMGAPHCLWRVSAITRTWWKNCWTMVLTSILRWLMVPHHFLSLHRMATSSSSSI